MRAPAIEVLSCKAQKPIDEREEMIINILMPDLKREEMNTGTVFLFSSMTTVDILSSDGQAVATTLCLITIYFDPPLCPKAYPACYAKHINN